MPKSVASATIAALALLGAAACSAEVEVGDGGRAAEIVGAAQEGIDGVRVVSVAEGTHTEEPVDYELRPPAGGPHNPVWVNCGFYDEAFPDENLVHDLEHGAVWLAYSPDLPDADVEVIRTLARDNAKVVAAPYDRLTAGEAVVATAWERQLRLETVDDERLEAFVAKYQDWKSAPEPGVTCGESPLGEPLP